MLFEASNKKTKNKSKKRLSKRAKDDNIIKLSFERDEKIKKSSCQRSKDMI